ncbi:MAG TPA: stage V sporulation protein AE [Clostridiales bacterium]|nr:stage V sporulation protein AE [Clostridiales bacterium]HCU55829.1 stage V sporulation protein AE [Clostridiales bacterium]
MVLTYLKVFAVGGALCMIGQLLINLTKMTSAKILVAFLLLGVLLEALGLFDAIKSFSQAGITIPITGFGSTLTKGAIEGVKEDGILGALTGGMKAAAAGLSSAIFFGFVISLICKSKTKV